MSITIDPHGDADPGPGGMPDVEFYDVHFTDNDQPTVVAHYMGHDATVMEMSRATAHELFAKLGDAIQNAEGR